MASETTPAERRTLVAGLEIVSMRKGAGAPLIVLHHSTGSTGWTPFLESLSEHFEVDVPDLPGFGQSTLPEWVQEPRDMGILMLQYLRRNGWTDVHVVGLGFGGFVAAEMAGMDPSIMSSLVLVGAAGLRPDEGEYLDQMLIDHVEYVKAGFRDEATAVRHLGDPVDRSLIVLWRFNRVMAARVTWKPYMFDLRLAETVREARVPTLVVHGAEDRVVPLSVAYQYGRAFPDVNVEVIEGAGHLVEIEEPQRIAALTTTHAAHGATV